MNMDNFDFQRKSIFNKTSVPVNTLHFIYKCIIFVETTVQ